MAWLPEMLFLARPAVLQRFERDKEAPLIQRGIPSCKSRHRVDRRRPPPMGTRRAGRAPLTERARAERRLREELLAWLVTFALAAASFSPDGALVLGAGGKEAILWRAATGERRHTLHLPGAVSSAVFSRDGRFLYVAVQGTFTNEGALLTFAPDGMNRAATTNTNGMMKHAPSAIERLRAAAARDARRTCGGVRPRTRARTGRSGGSC